jgi:hypothetical protein
MKTQLGYMARDQYGATIHLPDVKHPRKALLDKLGLKHADKVMVDCKSGPPKHIGYVIGRRWFTLYTVHEWSKAV